MAFVSWAVTLEELKDVMAGRISQEEFFYSAAENARQMRVAYTKLGNITDFYSWVEAKAAEEAVGGTPGQFRMSIGA